MPSYNVPGRKQSFSVSAANIEILKATIERNPGLTVRELAFKTNINMNAINGMLAAIKPLNRLAAQGHVALPIPCMIKPAWFAQLGAAAQSKVPERVSKRFKTAALRGVALSDDIKAERQGSADAFDAVAASSNMSPRKLKLRAAEHTASINNQAEGHEMARAESKTLLEESQMLRLELARNMEQVREVSLIVGGTKVRA